jgi:crotonobetainyl-CoA:carnitine CoA-transferase CaiB-like acyl-CoA transferase
MFETMAALVLGAHLGGRSFVPAEGETGYARLLAHARRPYVTADGHICALLYSDRQWESFCALIGQPQTFRQDPRLRDLGTRSRHFDALCAWVAQTLRTRTTGEGLQLLELADIPCMPMHTLESLLEDPHLRAVNFFRQTEHPSEGTLLSMSVPSHWSATPPDALPPAPRLGEHTAAVFAEAGLDAATAGTP